MQFVPRRPGLSLAEIVIAIALLSVVAVATIGLFLRLNASSTKSSDQSVALELASKLLEEAADATPQVWIAMKEGEQRMEVHDPAMQTTFYYRLDCPEVGSHNYMGQLYRLDVSVWWWPVGGQVTTRKDYGKLSLQLSRVVFLESLRTTP